MRKLNYLFSFFLLLLLLFSLTLFAQERLISGTVLSDDNKTPLQGVTVKVKGTTRSALTDANGNFSIKLNPGETVVFTYVGYQTAEVKPGSGNTISVGLKKDEVLMGEVTITAMEIKRSPRSLGYSAPKISGQEIAETQRANFVNALQGRVAGLTINPTSGLAGASSQVILRGYNSISGNNQPLFIVDGIITDNQTLNEFSNGGRGLGLASDRPNRNNDYTNRIADLNPNDIESVNILKGPEAAALYGSQAGSGAIIITTKKATGGKLSISYDNSFCMQKQSRILKLNNDYSTGINGVSSPNNFSYWGPEYPVNTTRYDNVHHFFRTGFTQTQNISVNFGYKNTGFRISGTYLDQKGVVPTNAYKKNNIRIANTTRAGKWLVFTPAFDYISSINDKAVRSAGGYLTSLYAWPADNDIRNYENPDGYKISVFASDPYAETDNPLYNVYRNHSRDNLNRYIISAGLQVIPFKWLTLTGNFGYDVYHVKGYTFYHPLSALTTRNQNGGLGALDNYWRQYHGYNHTIMATAKKSMGKFSGSLMLGTMWQDYKTEMFAVYGTGLIDSFSLVNKKMYKKGQVVTDQNFSQLVGTPADSNITRPATRIRLLRNNSGNYNISELREIAYLGEAGINYNNYLFLNYTHRFEAASVFPPEYRNYNYFGCSFSAILSDIFPFLKKKFLNYWKIRAARASTAKLPEPYANQSVLVNNFTSSNVGLLYSYGFDNNNHFLKPEKQHSNEIGTEAGFFNNRLSLEINYYSTNNSNVIVNQFRQSYATGFVLNTMNAGSLNNRGVEITIGIDPVKRKALGWNIRFNFYRGWSKVKSLPVSVQREYYNSDTWLYGNARGGLYLGGPTTTITGFHYQKNSNGDILINPSTGLPIVEGIFTKIGDRNPAFTLGTLTELKYKNWSLSFLWDLKAGGDVFNATDMYLTQQGKSRRTADREKPRVIKGVLLDGLQNSSTPTVNTIVIVPYFQQTYYTGMPEEEFVEHNISYLRLRDLTLSFNLPQRVISKVKYIKKLGFFFTGNELLLLTNYTGADPSVNGNTAGTRGVGGIGIDYGTVPTSVSLNFGVRAGF